MNIKNYSKIHIQEIAYLFSFFILFGARAIGLYEGKMLYNIALVIGLLIWGIKIILTEHSVAEYIAIGFFVFLALVVYKNTGEKGLLLYFTMMLGMKDVSARRVLKCGLGILSISYIVLVLTSVLGINNEIMYMQYRNGFGDVFRHALGYPHPNTLHTTYIILVVFVLYLIGKQNWKKLLLLSTMLFGISCYIYLYSGSRTGLLMSGIYLIVNFWFQIRKKLSIVEKMAVYSVYPACLIFSIIVPLIVEGKLYAIVNKVLNNRLMLAIYYLKNEPITLFGTRFKEAPDPHYMIDSSFLYSFLQLGLVAFLIITFLFLYMIHECIKEDKRGEIAIIVCFCIMGILDPFLFNLSYKNITFIFLGEIIYKYFKKVDNRLPEVLRYRIHILKIGNKEIIYSKIYNCYMKWEKKSIIGGMCLFIIVMLCSTAVYMSFKKVPNEMYVNQAIWDENRKRNLSHVWLECGEEFYLTNEKVSQLKQEGQLVFRYNDETEPMYRFMGDAPRMEYVRNVASVGFWSGWFAVSLFWIIMQKKKFSMRR